LNTFSTGGTNFSVYDLGSYATTQNDSTWQEVSFVLANYDKNPQAVAKLVNDMCANGQRKIGLTLWYMPANFDSSFVSSLGGKPSTKVESNIKAVINTIKNTSNSGAECFNEIQFRFAPIGVANPSVWDVWNEKQYQEDKSFIFYVRNLVKTSLSDSVIQVYYDLGAELGGLTDHQNIDYTKKLWSDYTSVYGVNDTYGFSIALDKDRFINLMNIYNSVGKKPLQHAIDIYDVHGTGMASQLSTLYSEMKQMGEQSTPVIIQETYFNDAKAMNEISESVNSLGIKIRSVMQWQVEREKWSRPDGA
jgi:hypothetical protein